MTQEDRLDELEEALDEHLEDFEDCTRQRERGELTLVEQQGRLQAEFERLVETYAALPASSPAVEL